MVKSELKAPSFRDFLRIIFSHLKLILSVFLGVLLLVLIISLITPPTYEASAKILVKERKVESPLQPTYYSDYRIERAAFLQSQTEIILSDEVARRVLKKLFPAKGEITPQQVKPFQAGIKVLSPKGYDITSSDILFIQVAGSNPVKAAEGANLLTHEYIDYTHELRARSSKQMVGFLEKQSQAQLEKMKQAEEQLKNFEGRSGPALAFLIATVKTKGASPELMTLNNNYLNARMTLEETESSLNQLRNLVKKGSFPQKMVRENPVLVTIKDNINKLENQLAVLRSQYTDLYPANKMILKQIDRTKQLLAEETKADIDSRFMDMVPLETRVRSLKEMVDQYTALAQKQTEYSGYYRNYETLEEGYQDLLRDSQKARLSEAMDTSKLASSIEVIDNAKAPKLPVKPNIILNVLIGAIIGILLGFGLAFVVDYLDHTLKSGEDVERHLNIPVLGAIPRL